MAMAANKYRHGFAPNFAEQFLPGWKLWLL